jgi:cytochrome b
MFKLQAPPDSVYVWDPFIRLFHWSLVMLFFIAYITEDDWLRVHVIAGYCISVLIGSRIIWGLIGSRYARFSQFIKSPATVIDYLKQMLRFKVPHYMGHNPAAAVMIIGLIVSITAICFSGIVIIAAENQGPLAGTALSSINANWMEDIHEFFANFTLLLVFVHIGGVIVSSLLEGENQVRAMITGRKKNRQSIEEK